MRKILLCVVLAAGLLASPAQAEWAGREGPLLVRTGVGWYSVQPDGSGLGRAESAREGLLSPDRTRLLAPENGALWVSDADGRGRQLLWGSTDPDIGLPDTEGWGIRSAAWAPDGRRIAFVASYYEHSESPAESALFVIGSDGRGVRRVDRADHLEPGLVRWLPSGRIAVRTEEQRLALMRPDGSRIRVLARLSGYPGEPAPFDFSPDGRRLVVVENGYDRVGNRFREWVALRTIDVATGAGKTLLRRSPSFYGERPALPVAAWSPSGGRIAFVLNPLPVRSGGRNRWPDPHTKLYTIRPDGTRMRLLARIPPRPGGTPTWGWDVSWSRR